MSFMEYYILDKDHQVVEASPLEWARWFDEGDRIVAQEETELYFVSTVFLGLDHGWGDGPPVLFETMVFTRERQITEHFGRLWSIKKSVDEDGMMLRYSTWDDAEAGHRTLVRRLQKLEADAKEKLRVKS